MNSYTLTIFVLIFRISFCESFFSKLPELRNNVGHKYVCENSKSENKDGPTIEQGSSCTSYDKADKDLETRIIDIKRQCGKLCEPDLPTLKLVTKGRYYDHLKVEINCHGLWNASIFDEPSKFQHAPQTLPSYIKKDFSYKNQVPIHSYYLDNRVEEERDRDNASWAWTKKGIDMQLQWLKEGTLNGGYGVEINEIVINKVKEYISVENKHVLVIGSKLPWIEVILLSLNVGSITTLEYNRYVTDHPKINILSPPEFGDLVRSKKAPMFDALLTFSSLEHSGLGRYGDQLNPWGDVIAMARAWCQMKSGARALIGVPTGRDTVCFNAHRIYGPFLYSYLFTNWKQIYSMVDKRIFEMKIDCKTSALYHPIHILEK